MSKNKKTMKENIFKIVFFLMLAVCTAGCNTNKKEDITTTLFPSSILFLAEETIEKGVHVITQGLIDWDFDYSADWFTVEVENNKIIVTPKTANTASEKREANITITTLGYSPVILPVIQFGISGKYE